MRAQSRKERKQITRRVEKILTERHCQQLEVDMEKTDAFYASL